MRSDFQTDWRRPVKDHFVLLTYPFQVAQDSEVSLEGDQARNEQDVAEKAAKTIADGTWSHWLLGQLDSDDDSTVEDLLNEAFFFKNPFRQFIFPEIDGPPVGDIGVQADKSTLLKRVEARITKLKSGSLEGQSLRLRATLSGVDVEVTLPSHADSKKRVPYRIAVTYVDVCLFPNSRAVIVVCVSGITRAESDVRLNTAELGWVVRKLKRMRNRYRGTPPVTEWSRFLDPFFTPWGRSLSQLTAARDSSSFRAITFCLIAGDNELRAQLGSGPFRSARERLYYELATGHDTTLPRELPAPGQAIEFASDATIGQWHSFDAAVYWGDITVLAEDLADPDGDSTRDGTAMTWIPPGLPAQARSSFVWLMVLASYEEMTSREYLRMLSLVAEHDLSDPLPIGSAVSEYMRYISDFSHFPLTESRFGTAIYLALVRMFNLAELREAASDRLTRLQTQIETAASHRKAQGEWKTQRLVAVLGVWLGLVAIVTTVLADKIAKFQFLRTDATPEVSFWLSAGLVLAGIVFAIVMWPRTQPRSKRASKSGRNAIRDK